MRTTSSSPDDRHGPLADACGRRPSSSGPSSSSSGPLSTSSCRLRVPTTGARATPSCSPTSASASGSPSAASALAAAGGRPARSRGSRGGRRRSARRRGRRRRGRSRRRAERWPCSRAPSSTSPAPTPVPTRTHHQPAVAGVAEGVLAEHGGVGVVGDEDRHVEAPRAARRPAACRTSRGSARRRRCPSASTTPGLPTPMPSTGRSVSAISSRGQVVHERDGVLAAAPRRAASSWRSWTSPARLMHAPRSCRSSADRSIADDVAGVRGQADQHRGLADPAPGPARRARRPAPRRPARRPGRRRSPGSARWCGPGRPGSPGRRGRAAAAAAPGGGDGRPPGGACPGGGAGVRGGEVVVTFVSTSYLLIPVKRIRRIRRTVGVDARSGSCPGRQLRDPTRATWAGDRDGDQDLPTSRQARGQPGAVGGGHRGRDRAPVLPPGERARTRQGGQVGRRLGTPVRRRPVLRPRPRQVR